MSSRWTMLNGIIRDIEHRPVKLLQGIYLVCILYINTGWGVRVTLKEDTRSHYNDVIMSAMASQITSLTIVYSGADQRKHQSSVSLAFVRGNHRWPMHSPHKGPVMLKMVPFDDVIMSLQYIIFFPISEFCLLETGATLLAKNALIFNFLYLAMQVNLTMRARAFYLRPIKIIPINKSRNK